jgi:hypothetical protein
MLNFAADSINDMIDMAKGQIRDFNKYIKMSKNSSIVIYFQPFDIQLYTA